MKSLNRTASSLDELFNEERPGNEKRALIFLVNHDWEAILLDQLHVSSLNLTINGTFNEGKAKIHANMHKVQSCLALHWSYDRDKDVFFLVCI